MVLLLRYDRPLVTPRVENVERDGSLHHVAVPLSPEPAEAQWISCTLVYQRCVAANPRRLSVSNERRMGRTLASAVNGSPELDLHDLRQIIAPKGLSRGKLAVLV